MPLTQAGRTTSTNTSGPVGDGEQADALRIVEVFVQDAGYAGRLEVRGRRCRVSAAGEGEQLHVEPLVRALRLARF